MTSSGKVLLAFLPAEEQKRALTKLRLAPKTPRSITTVTALREELARVRHQGYAENRGESQPGMCSIAAPVRDPVGRVVASVSVAVHVDDVDAGLPHLVRPVVDAAAHISANLGWRS